MATRYTQQFKEIAVQYYFDHKELSFARCADDLGVYKTTLSKWVELYKENSIGDSTRELGNYFCNKENIRLRKKLKNTQNDLEILKKAINVFNK